MFSYLLLYVLVLISLVCMKCEKCIITLEMVQYSDKRRKFVRFFKINV